MQTVAVERGDVRRRELVEPDPAQQRAYVVLNFFAIAMQSRWAHLADATSARYISIH
jgi:hypothetical protein